MVSGAVQAMIPETAGTTVAAGLHGDVRERQAGLYLHVPFCSTICPYCDFAKVGGSPEGRAAFVRSAVREIELYRGFPLSFDTIYFGGGTPSTLEPADLERLARALRGNLRIRDDSRMFLEANPDDVHRAALRAWRRLGVSTLSLGVQSFHDGELEFLGRRHGASEARRSIEAAHEAGFDTLSIDLIFGLPGQGPRAWEENLREAARWSPDHISCYQLTVHARTAFGRRRVEGRLEELCESAQAELFGMAHEILESAEYEAYEVSNFARSPRHRSRHNRKYWDHTPYLGIGPSAHSFHRGLRWWNERGLRNYEERLARSELPVAGTETLSREDLALEALMLRLRTAAGIHLDDYRRRYGVDLLALNAELIERYCAAGILRLESGRLRPTRRGLAVADGLARALELAPATAGSTCEPRRP